MDALIALAMAGAGILFLMLCVLTLLDRLEEKVVFEDDLKRVAELDADDEGWVKGNGS